MTNLIRSAAWLVAMVAMTAVAHAQEQTVTRVTEFSYDAATGLLTKETVEPGNSHCVETQYTHDTYGNRQRVLVQPCASTTPAARFEPRVTLNEFSAKSTGAAHLQYPAGAFQTRSRTGGLAMEGSAQTTVSEVTADYHPGFGTALVKTEVAHRAVANNDNNKNISKRVELDGLGRVLREYSPVSRNADGSVVEAYVEYRTAYCLGTLLYPRVADPACINYQPSQSITVHYASRMLHDSAGSASKSLTPKVVSAYFVEAAPKNSAGDVIGARSRVHYDSLHREVAKESETYSGQWSMTLTAYDQLGMASVTWGAYFGRTSGGAFTPPNDDTMQWTGARDVLHRPTQQAQYWRGRDDASLPREVLRSDFAYNGLETSVTIYAAYTPDGQSRTSTARKHASGQMAQTIDANGATLNSAYDPVGNLIETVDAFGNRTTIGYTAGTARFKVSMSDPNQGTWQYGYDALGQLMSQTDANGAVTSMTYDVLGRLTHKANPTQNSNWYYDRNAVGTWCASGLNRLCETTAGNNPLVSREVHSYDTLGRATQTATTLDRTYVSQTSFDTLGRVDTVRYPTGFTIRHGYSSAGNGRIAGVLDRVYDNADANRVFWRIDTVSNPQDVFDARGNLRRAQLGNGVGINNVFDPISGKAFKLEAGTGTLMQSVLRHQYIYDKANNVAERRERINELTETFLYDRLNRLTSYQIGSTIDVGANRVVTVDYNAIGNILNKSDVGGYTYAAPGQGRPHAVLAAGGTNYQYDANGQMVGATGVQSRSHTWTAFNLPATMSYGLRNVRFNYDHDYQRVKEVAYDGSKTRTLYLVHPNNVGGLGYEREETVGGGTTVYENRHYISVGGVAIAVVKTRGTAAEPLNGTVSTDASLTNYWHKDSLGSIVAVSRADGTVLERMAFDPWGRRLLNTGRFDAVHAGQGPSHGDRGFTGHEHLDELGLIHMNGRIYDPLLGRFLSPDPIIQSPDDLQNYNRYSYVLNNPLIYTDPSGHCIEPISCVAVKVFAVFVAAAMIAEGNKHWRMVGGVMLAWALGGADGLIEAGLGDAPAVASAAADGFFATPSVFNGGEIVNSMLAGGITGLATSGGDVGQGIVSAMTAGAFTAAGAAPISDNARVVMHAVIGCASQAASGGKCGPGAMSAAFGKLATQHLPMNNILVTTIVGGTASVIGGGKFANGAVTAAMGYLFNCQATRSGNCGDPNSNDEVSGQAVQDPAAGMKFAAAVVPGGDALECYFEGCSAVGWGLAAVGMIPGGKGVTLSFKSAHYAKRLTAVGLDAARVEAAVAADIAKIPANSLTVRGDFGNRIVVDDVPVIYRAQPQPGGTINVGTIHPDDGRWMRK